MLFISDLLILGTFEHHAFKHARFYMTWSMEDRVNKTKKFNKSKGTNDHIGLQYVIFLLCPTILY
jgi:hypothetical protein